MKFAISFLYLFFMLILCDLHAQDWPNFNRYRQDNYRVGMPSENENRIVFMGNSITEGWSNVYPEFFNGKPYINRGISGQTTPQMLVRFRADVIDLKPKAVVILAGTNDIAGNTGPSTVKMIADNIFSMAELAREHNISVIISSILPVYQYSWIEEDIDPVPIISRLNAIIRNYALKNGHIYLDYYSAMVDERMGLMEKYTPDGVHANKAGYKVMSALAEKAIIEALK